MQDSMPPDHLEIHQGKLEEVYRDIVRIPENVRLDSDGTTIDEGHVCKIKNGLKTAYVIVRGVKNFDLQGSPAHHHGRCIHMDEVTRKRLGVEGVHSARFELDRVGRLGEFKWAWNATEIGYRISSRLALLGFVLGLVAVLPELFKWAQEFIPWIQKHICLVGR